MEPRLMALAIDWDGLDVHYIEGEDPEPWLDVIERISETCAEGAIVTTRRLTRNVHDMGADVYRIDYEKPGALTLPEKWTEYYLVRPEIFGWKPGETKQYRVTYYAGPYRGLHIVWAEDAEQAEAKVRQKVRREMSLSMYADGYKAEEMK